MSRPNNNNAVTARSDDAVLKLFNDKELSANVVKLKSTASSGVARKGATNKKSANWKDSRQSDNQHDKPSPIKSPGPVVTQLDEKDISTFPTGRPLHDELVTVMCKYCKKPIITTFAAEHVRACLKAKAEKAKERKKKQKEEAAAAAAAAGKSKDDAMGAAITAPTNGEGEDAAGAGTVAGSSTSVVPAVEAKKKKGPGAKKMAKKDSEGGAKGKKRKADEAKLPKEPKAKKKKEKLAKPEPKVKAPVDVEKQCGVPLPNGALCARSLTCKSHSMGAKRSVVGRSQPYDVLLLAYQKKNQAKQQKAAITAGAAPPEELEANAMPVDSDEETELVMAAIAKRVPRPMERHVVVPVRKKSQYIRMRELMASALRPAGQSLFNSDAGGGPNGILGGVLGGPKPGSSKPFQPPPPPSQRKPSLNTPG